MQLLNLFLFVLAELSPASQLSPILVEKKEKLARYSAYYSVLAERGSVSYGAIHMKVSWLITIQIIMIVFTFPGCPGLHITMLTRGRWMVQRLWENIWWGTHVTKQLEGICTLILCVVRATCAGESLQSHPYWLILSCAPASGTSIEKMFYVTLSRLRVTGVKRWGPVTRLGLKLDLKSLGLTWLPFWGVFFR